MSGLDRITGQIVQEAQESERRILAEAREKAQETGRQAMTDCQALLEQSAARCEAEKKDVLRRSASASKRKHRQLLLSARQSLIDETLDRALKELLELPGEAYFQTLVRMAGAHARDQQGTLWLNAKDLARMPENFPAEIARAGKEAGGSLVVSQTPCEIQGGFLLKYGAVEENGSFEALFSANRERLRDRLNAFLFES